MEVTAEVLGEGTAELSLPEDATYAELCHALEYSPHEVTVLVDGSPVPSDKLVDAREVEVVRLIKGG